MHREWKKHARNINSIICCRKKPLLQTSAALRVSVDEQDQEDETCTPSEQQQHIFYHTLHRSAMYNATLPHALCHMLILCVPGDVDNFVAILVQILSFIIRKLQK